MTSPHFDEFNSSNMEQVKKKNCIYSSILQYQVRCYDDNSHLIRIKKLVSVSIYYN